MKSFWSRAALVLTLAAALAVASPAHAGLVVTFQESGPDVVATLSGSFSSLPTPNRSANATLVNGFLATNPYFDSTNQAAAGSTVTVALNDYNFVTAFPNFGTSSNAYFATATAGLNTSLFIDFTRVALPSSYTSGTSFTGTLTWAGQSFTSMSLTTGSYVGTLSNAETVTINVGVPEPSTSAIALAGLACGGYTMFRRRNRA